MKKNIILPILILLSSTCLAEDIYVYPPIIKIDMSCELSNEKLDEIGYNYSDPEAGVDGMAKAFPVNLNLKGGCEIFIDNPAIYEGNGNSFTTLLVLEGVEYRSVGDIQGEPSEWWYGKFINGYPRIFVPTYSGHSTNPINVVDVYYFNGTTFTAEFDSEYSHGYFSDLGFKAYKAKNYNLAEKWYLNAYRMGKEESINDANNLAITFIKQNKCEQAVYLLEKHLKRDNVTEKQKKSAMFNMALCNPS